MKAKLLAGLIAAIALVVPTASIAAGSGTRVRVDPVESDRVQRLFAWGLATNPASGSIVAPATCAPDPAAKTRVWFMPLFFGSGSADVNCKVPDKTTLVLNIGGTLCPEDVAGGYPRSTLVSCAIQSERDHPGLQTVIVDGKDTDEFADDDTAVFDATLPANNVFGLPAGTRGFAYDGRNLAIRGLERGDHTIRVIYRLAPTDFQFDVDITYHVTIA